MGIFSKNKNKTEFKFVLEHDFNDKAVKGWWKKIIYVDPPTYGMTLDIKKADQDNPQLLEELSILWNDVLCPRGQKGMDMILRGATTIILSEFAKLGKKKGSWAAVQKAVKQADTDVCDYLLNVWSKQAEKAIDKHLEKWNKTNKKAYILVTKRMAKLAKEIVTLSKDIAALVAKAGADAKAWYDVAKQAKKVVDALHTIFDDLNTKFEKTLKVVKETGVKVSKLTSADFNGPKDKLKKKWSQIFSPLNKSVEEIEKYSKEALLLASKSKKLGADLNKVLKAMDGSPLDDEVMKPLETEVDRLIKKILEVNDLSDRLKKDIGFMTSSLDDMNKDLNAAGITPFFDNFKKRHQMLQKIVNAAADGAGSAETAVQKINVLSSAF